MTREEAHPPVDTEEALYWSTYPLEMMARGHVPNDEEVRRMCVVISALQSRVEQSEAELATIKTAGIIEVAVRNPNVADYMQHWEGRTEKAEAERDRLRAEAERAWRDRNEYANKVRAWESLVIMDGPMQIHPGKEWGPGGEAAVSIPATERIVDVIDRLRSDLDKARARAAAVLEEAAEFKQLADAMADRLNEMTRENDLSVCYDMAVGVLDMHTDASASVATDAETDALDRVKREERERLASWFDRRSALVQSWGGHHIAAAIREGNDG